MYLHVVPLPADPTAPKSLKGVTSELAKDAGKVLSQPVWLHMCAAYIMYTAVLGVYAFWGPKAGKRIYHMSGESADVIFGGVTVITGVFGSLGGGLALDALGSTLWNANLLCGVSNFVGLVFVLTAFLAARNFTVFIVLFAIGELALFMIQAPVNAIGMWSVPAALRPLAISMVTVSIHLLGDVPSPPLVGALQSALEHGKPHDQADQQWRISMSVISLLLFFSGCMFLRGSCVSRKAKDYRKDDDLAIVASVAEDHQRHLPRPRPGHQNDSLHHVADHDAEFPRDSGHSKGSGYSRGLGLLDNTDMTGDQQPLLDTENPGSNQPSPTDSTCS